MMAGRAVWAEKVAEGRCAGGEERLRPRAIGQSETGRVEVRR